MDGLGVAQELTACDDLLRNCQGPIKHEEKKMNTYAPKLGSYRYTRTSLGSQNGPATFQRMLDIFLGGVQEKTCFVYKDELSSLQNTIAKKNKTTS